MSSQRRAEESSRDGEVLRRDRIEHPLALMFEGSLSQGKRGQTHIPCSRFVAGPNRIRDVLVFGLGAGKSSQSSIRC